MYLLQIPPGDYPSLLPKTQSLGGRWQETTGADAKFPTTGDLPSRRLHHRHHPPPLQIPPLHDDIALPLEIKHLSGKGPLYIHLFLFDERFPKPPCFRSNLGCPVVTMQTTWSLRLLLRQHHLRRPPTCPYRHLLRPLSPSQVRRLFFSQGQLRHHPRHPPPPRSD